MRLPIPLLLSVALVLTACDSKKPAGDIVRREGQPDMLRVPGEDPEMNKAIQTARDTVQTFTTALRSRTATQNTFTVKKPFKQGDQVEHIWLSDVSFDGTQFSGRVDNEPVDVTNVRLGQTATAAPGEISDWFYIENGKLVGGYTIRVLHARMPPAAQKDFSAKAGFKLE